MENWIKLSDQHKLNYKARIDRCLIICTVIIEKKKSVIDRKRHRYKPVRRKVCQPYGSHLQTYQYDLSREQYVNHNVTKSHEHFIYTIRGKRMLY